MDVLAQLDLGSPSVRLRRARAADVPAIIGLLAGDPLGAGRDGLRTAADLAAYAELGFVASHEGLKLAL